MDQHHPDFDLTFRPDYWRPSDPISLIIANVKGEVRRRQILDVLEGRHRLVVPGTELPEQLMEDSLSEEDRAAWGAVHPAMMGGEYLPDYSRGEMEIARIVLASTTMDVVSIRARRSHDLGIHYSVVDEYETSFTFHPTSSEAPLSLGEIVSLLDSIRSDEDPMGRPWMEWVREFNYGDANRDRPERIAHFATVHSPLYPRLHAYYHWRNEQWLARERARIAAAARRPGRRSSTPDASAPGEEAAR
jgi:hypothetical protein